MSDPQQPTQPQAYPPPGYPPPAYQQPAPAAAPAYGYPGYPTAPRRSPGATMLLFSRFIVIAAYVAAGAGVLAGFMTLAETGDGLAKFVAFLTAFGSGVGIGAVALGAGLLVQTRAREEIRREQSGVAA